MPINVKNSLTDQTENAEMQRERLGQVCCWCLLLHSPGVQLLRLMIQN